MKRCPLCQAVFSDDINFCLSDGTLLVFENSRKPETLVIKDNQRKQGVNPIFAYLFVGLLALLLGGGLVAWVMSQKSDENLKSGSNKSAGPNISTSNKEVKLTPTPEKSKENSQNNLSVETKSTPLPSREEKISDTKKEVIPLTTDAVEDLIIRWENAQEERDFSGYESCYNKAFLGIKKIDNSSKSYNYEEWMNDRRGMLNQAKMVDIEVTDLKITFDGSERETATVEFIQRYHSIKRNESESKGDFCDWGPKMIKVKSFPNGPKIVYEELKISNKC